MTSKTIVNEDDFKDIELNEPNNIDKHYDVGDAYTIILRLRTRLMWTCYLLGAIIFIVCVSFPIVIITLNDTIKELTQRLYICEHD